MATAVGTINTVFKSDVSSLLRGVKTSDKAVSGFSSTLAGLSGIMVGLAGAAGFGMLAAATIRTGAQFERTMATVQGVTRATAQEFEDLTAVAREMGATTEWTANQAAEALRFLGMAGFSADRAIAALPDTLNIATAGAIDLGRAADIVTNALTGMQLGVEDLGRVGDVFIGTITRSNTDMNMMAESFKYAAPVAKAFGYDIEELSAMIGVLGNAGVQGSMAGTQLAFAFQKSAKMAEQFGIPGANFTQVLEEMNKRGLGASEIMRMFGMRGGRAALILKDLIPEVDRLTVSLKNSEGEAKALADRMNDTVIGSWRNFKSALEALSLDVFDKLREPLQGFLDALTKGMRDIKSNEGWMDAITDGAQMAVDVFAMLSRIILDILKGFKWLKLMSNESKIITQEGKVAEAREKLADATARVEKADKARLETLARIDKLETQTDTTGKDNTKKLKTEYKVLANLLTMKSQARSEEKKAQTVLKESNKEIGRLNKNYHALTESIDSLNNVQELITETQAKWNETLDENNEKQKLIMSATEDVTRVLLEQAEALYEVDRMYAQVEQTKSDSQNFSSIGQDFDPNRKHYLDAEDIANEARSSRIRAGNAILESMNKEQKAFKSQVEVMGEELDVVFQGVATRIADIMADAFYQIAKTGKFEMQQVGDIMMQMGSQIAATQLMSGNWYGAAAGGGMMAFGAMSNKYWEIDDSTRNMLDVASLGGNEIFKRMGLFGDKPKEGEDLVKALKELKKGLSDYHDGLARDLFMVGDNIHGFSMDIYDASQRFKDTSAAIDKIAREERWSSSNSAMSGVVSGNQRGDQMEAIMGIIGARITAWSDYMTELFIISKQAAEEIENALDDYKSIGLSSFDKAMKAVGEDVSDKVLQAQSIVDSYTMLGEGIARLISERANFWDTPIDTARLRSDAMVWNPGKKDESGEYVFSQRNYDKLYAEAVAQKQNVWDSYTKAIADERIKLSGLETEFMDATEYLALQDDIVQQVVKEFADKRSEIRDSISDYMIDLIGDQGEVAKAIASTNERFESFADQIEDMGGSIQELAAVEIQRLEAVGEATKKVFKDIQDDIDTYLTNKQRANWDTGDWLGYIGDLSNQMDNLDPGSSTYYDDALDLAEKQWDALMSLDGKASEQLSALESTYSSIGDLITEIRGGDMSAVTSYEFFADRYKGLLEAAMNPDATAEDVAEYEGYVPEFLDFMASFGPDYKSVTDAVIRDLEMVQGNITDISGGLELEVQSQEALLTDIAGTLDVKLQNIVDGIDRQTTALIAIVEGETPAPPPEVPETTIVPSPQIPGDPNYTIPEDELVTIMPVPENPLDDGVGLIDNKYPPEPEIPTPVAVPEPEVPTNITKTSIPTTSFTGTNLSDWEDSQTTWAADNWGPPGGGRAEGGWIGSNGIYEVGEKGGEWVMPTYEPEKSAFLESTGLADQIKEIVAEGGGGNDKPIVIENKLYIDGAYVGDIVGTQARNGHRGMLDELERSLG